MSCYAEPLLTEAQLITLLQQGDQQAFSYLYDRYAPPLYGFIKTTIASDEWAEEVLLEVFVHVWRYIDCYNLGQIRLFSWMVRLAQEAALTVVWFHNRGKAGKCLLK